MILTHGANSLPNAIPHLIAICRGTASRGFGEVLYNANKTELVSGVLDSPVYANVGNGQNVEHIVSSSNADLMNRLLTGDFTIECYFKKNFDNEDGGSGSPIFGLISKSSTLTWELAVACTKTGTFTLWVNDEYKINAVTSSAVITESYKHLALTKKTTDNKCQYSLYFNGNRLGSAVYQAQPITDCRFVMPIATKSTSYGNKYRVDWNVIQLCVWDYAKYTEPTYNIPTEVYPI